MTSEELKNELWQKTERRGKKLYDNWLSWTGGSTVHFGELNDVAREMWISLALGKSKKVEKSKPAWLEDSFKRKSEQSTRDVPKPAIKSKPVRRKALNNIDVPKVEDAHTVV
jgi:hypothetical protein